jgi:type I restriction enzyme S subunit
VIHNLKPYPAYKESGLPWVGEVPEHWALQRLDRLFNLRNEPPLEGDQRVTGYLDGRVTLRSNVSGQKIKGVVKEAGWQRVHPGDFAISGMNAHLGGMGVSDSLGKSSPIYLILKPKEDTNAHFVSHAVRRAAHSGALKALVNTIRFNSADFKRDDLKRIWVCLPSILEQSAIVRFLDHADRRIRRYIRAKKKLIALLNEQKQAIIHRAVTSGLNPDVRLKSSGVEWLGGVPEHWEVMPLKRLLTKMDYGTSENLGREGNVRVLTMGHIKDGEVVPPVHGSLDSVPAALLLEMYDLLFNRTNSPDLVGKVGLFRGTAADNISFASYLVRLRTKDSHNPRWLNWLLNSTRFWTYARSQAFVSLHQANLNSTRYGQMLLPVPPFSEQGQIAEYLHGALAGIGQGVTAAVNEISLLHEYRTRLIADVVTGKLDVREAAARLPDETEELEPLDETEALAEGDEEDGGSEEETEA